MEQTGFEQIAKSTRAKAVATARALSMSIDETEDIAQNVMLTPDELKKTWMAKLNDNCLFISAKNKINIEKLRDTLYKTVRELHVQKRPYNDFSYSIE
jgi:ribosome-interacting GTPase 1